MSAQRADDNEELRRELHAMRALLFPRRPTGSPWLPIKSIAQDSQVWQQGCLRVVSTVECPVNAAGELDPRWRLSVVVMGHARRPSAVEMSRVRRAFGMLEAAEDPRPGNARHLYLRVAPAEAVDSAAEGSAHT